jgi:hypothetical protein
MCSVCETQAARNAADTLEIPHGAVAQLVEHVHGMHGVRGSIPLSSTQIAHPFHRVWRAIGFTLAGFVAGEAWFGTRERQERFLRDGSVRLSFGFAVTIARRDRAVLEALATFLGQGTIRNKPTGARSPPAAQRVLDLLDTRSSRRHDPLRRDVPAPGPETAPVRGVAGLDGRISGAATHPARSRTV